MPSAPRATDDFGDLFTNSPSTQRAAVLHKRFFTLGIIKSFSRSRQAGNMLFAMVHDSSELNDRMRMGQADNRLSGWLSHFCVSAVWTDDDVLTVAGRCVIR